MRHLLSSNLPTVEELIAAEASRRAQQSKAVDEKLEAKFLFYYTQGFRDGLADRDSKLTRENRDIHPLHRFPEPSEADIEFLRDQMKKCGIDISSEQIRRLHTTGRMLLDKVARRSSFTA